MSELALRLIADNKKHRAPVLDLGDCDLKAIPREIRELVWLEKLAIGGALVFWDGLEVAHEPRIAGPGGGPNASALDLEPLASLTALKSLSVSAADPAPLAALTELEALALDTAAVDLSPLAGMSKLQVLSLSDIGSGGSGYDFEAIASLKSCLALSIYSEYFADLSPLAGARALAYISAGRADKIKDLGPLAELADLQVLSLGRADVTDLNPLARLHRLRTLYLFKSTIDDLKPLAGLTSLERLDVSGTQVSDLSPLGGLDRLVLLDVADTKVSDLGPVLPHIRSGLEVSWTTSAWGGVGLHVRDCPFTSPPAEIVKQGRRAILNYFDQREAGDVDHLYEAKLLILGEGGAGKTTLMRRLYRPSMAMPAEQDSTKGIDIYRHEFTLKDGKQFRLNVWDFGGQEIYHATHQFFLTHRSLYLLLDDTRKDHKSVSDEGFKYWLDLIDLFGGHSPVLIFQNEKSGRSKAIDIAGIKGQYDNVMDRYAGNLEHPDAANALRDAIEFFAARLSHVGEELPARWLRVRADIEAHAAAVPHISQHQYFEIYRQHIDFDRTQALHLSRYLHDLGVFLHFQDDPILTRTVILQNQWATGAVFRVLDDESVKARFGRFTAADCGRLWADPIYADMHPELLALMQRFELCYALPDSKPQTWLAPQLLPPARPGDLPGAPHTDGTDLVLRYRYEFLPKGMISRLTVRMHRFVRNPSLAWVTGVLFERDDTSVLVELLPAGKEIELRARGPERKALLSVIAADLDALNDSLHRLREKVDKGVPCLCTKCRGDATPHFFEQKSLRKRVEDRRLKIECPRSYEDVDVLALLDGVSVTQLPHWAVSAPAAAATRTLSIFLASSSELEGERDAFDLFIRQLNDHLTAQGVYLKVVRWEHFLDAMSDTRLQDEYNRAIRACDVFVSLFFTKTGTFTEEEFNAAWEQFVNTRRPRIYTFFKNAEIRTGDAREEELGSLWSFKKRLRKLGHYPTEYDNIDQLKYKFREQLDRLIEEGL